MSEAFYQAVIIIHALFLSFGWLMVVSAARGFKEAEGGATAEHIPTLGNRRKLVSYMMVTMFFLALVVLMLTPSVLGGSIGDTTRIVEATQLLTLMNLGLVSHGSTAVITAIGIFQ